MRWLILLLFTFPVFGTYIGNPASPAVMNMGIFSGPSPFFKFTSGYLADYTSNKRFTSTDSFGVSDGGQSFHEFGVHSQMATASTIFVERFEFFGSVGGSKEHMKWDREPNYLDMPKILGDFDSSYTFSWGVGCKAILIKWWQTYLGADFTYFDIPANHQSYFKFFNRLNLPLDHEKQTFSMNEWQLSLGLSSKIWIFTPYGGVSYLNSKLNIHSSDLMPALYYKNDESIGFFYGLTLSLSGRFHVNFERRVRDEFAYSIAGIAVF
jgi:hypothetical protein